MRVLRSSMHSFRQGGALPFDSTTRASMSLEMRQFSTTIPFSRTCAPIHRPQSTPMSADEVQEVVRRLLAACGVADAAVEESCVAAYSAPTAALFAIPTPTLSKVMRGFKSKAVSDRGRTEVEECFMKLVTRVRCVRAAQGWRGVVHVRGHSFVALMSASVLPFASLSPALLIPCRTMDACRRWWRQLRGRSATRTSSRWSRRTALLRRRPVGRRLRRLPWALPRAPAQLHACPPRMRALVTHVCWAWGLLAPRRAPACTRTAPPLPRCIRRRRSFRRWSRPQPPPPRRPPWCRRRCEGRRAR
jgi:hypothetical protein